MARLDLPFSGEALRRARQKRGMWQKDLADKLSAPIDRTVISKYELGTLKPSPPRLLDIAKALDIEVDDLLAAEEVAS